jgi:D-glycero-alpha-D-manno-heptose-7-phosphate kinase
LDGYFNADKDSKGSVGEDRGVLRKERLVVIISKTPFRMSFFGGGTDFPDFYKEYGGAVISSTFDKYCYVNVRHLPHFFDYSTELAYSIIERVLNVDEIKHPAIREAMKMLDMHEIRLTYEADLPARSGLGTSSSFAVGMLNAFYALKGKYADKRKLADEAIYLERTLCNENGGVQDQIAAAFGGFNRINFNAEGYTVDPIIISPGRKRELNESLMLYFTGFSRFSSEIQADTQAALNNKKSQLQEMLELLDEAENILTSKRDLNEFGRLLDHTWKLKRGITDMVSTDSIDALYAKAIKAGATGGKLLGAGGGGFLLFYVEKEKRDRVRKAMENLLYVPFEFENAGAQIIYYTPENFTPVEELEKMRMIS